MAFDKISEDTKVLVVDDYLAMRRVIRELLRTIGIENVEEAESGKEALGRLQQGGIDLVISDSDMPNMKGIELLQAARSDSGLEKVPFVMIASDAEKDEMEEAMKAEASDYVLKPFSAEVLREKLVALLE